MQTLEQWQQQLDNVLLNIKDSFLKLGETLFLARRELNTEEYAKLTSYVDQWGLKAADVDSAIAAFLYTRRDLGTEKDKRINPKLVFCGAKNSKILFMDDQDQQRLISGEKFDVLMSNGKPDKPKTFAEMNDIQRNTLIGKGGKILSLTEQVRAMKGSKNNKSVQEIGSLECNKNKIVFSSKDGNVCLHVTTDVLARMLLIDGSWDALVDAAKDAQQEMGHKKAV